MTFSRLIPFLQCLGTPISQSASHHSCHGRFTLAACSSGFLCPHHLSGGVFHSQDPGNNFNLFSLDPSAPSAPQDPSTPAPLPPTWHRTATTTLGLGQQEVRPKGQQTVGSRPHASRLRMQLCFHGNLQSHGSTAPSRSSRAPCPTPLNPPAAALRGHSQ